MTDRENLIELIGQVQYLGGLELALADHLLANGVTIQRRIPVMERLPENGATVWVYRPTMAIKQRSSYYFNRFCDGALDIHGNEVITHWMPLPEPPKDGER